MEVNVYELAKELTAQLKAEQLEYQHYSDGMLAGIETFVEKLMERLNAQATQTINKDPQDPAAPIETPERPEEAAGSELTAVENSGYFGC